MCASQSIFAPGDLAPGGSFTALWEPLDRFPGCSGARHGNCPGPTPARCGRPDRRRGLHHMVHAPDVRFRQLSRSAGKLRNAGRISSSPAREHHGWHLPRPGHPPERPHPPALRLHAALPAWTPKRAGPSPARGARAFRRRSAAFPRTAHSPPRQVERAGRRWPERIAAFRETGRLRRARGKRAGRHRTPHGRTDFRRSRTFLMFEGNLPRHAGFIPQEGFETREPGVSGDLCPAVGFTVGGWICGRDRSRSSTHRGVLRAGRNMLRSGHVPGGNLRVSILGNG